jgi:hypothetical protein
MKNKILKVLSAALMLSCAFGLVYASKKFGESLDPLARDIQYLRDKHAACEKAYSKPCSVARIEYLPEIPFEVNP